jgi:hypothetical protein
MFASKGNDRKHHMFMPIVSSCIPEASLFPLLISEASKFWGPGSDWILIAGFRGLQTFKDEGSLDSLKEVNVGLLEDVIWWTDWACNVPTVIPEQSTGTAEIIFTDQCLDLRPELRSSNY